MSKEKNTEALYTLESMCDAKNAKQREALLRATAALALVTDEDVDEALAYCASVIG